MRKITVIENGDTQRTNSGQPITNLNYQKRLFRYFLVILPFALILLISTSYQQNPDAQNYFEREYHSPEIIDSLRNFILTGTGNNLATLKNSPSYVFLKNFYLRNDYKPLWIHYNGLSERATSLIYLIEHSREYGLEPQNYQISAIRALRDKPDQDSGVRKEIVMDFNLEILLTDAAFRFMINLHAGYIPFDSVLYAAHWVNDLPAILLKGVSNGKIIENMLSVEPKFIEYTRLRKANEYFIKTNTLTDHAAVISYPNKDTAVLIFEIKEALIALGYLDINGTADDYTEALKKFQQFHGLNADGKPGVNTIEALGKSTLYRYRVLALNLDRLRKKQYADSSLLYVNIPAYQMKIFDWNNIKETFRIIVGNPASPTPLLSAKMDRIIANPVWYVPKSIAINEMLPKIKADSSYLEKNGFRILDKNYHVVNANELDLAGIKESDFNYTFRQNRGSDNSLGLAKFIFTNPYAIYIHDTPGKTMFSKDLRAFSHGCIRVENPERLANYILGKINSDTTDFSRLMTTGRHHEFKVTSPLSIHITYVTCEANEKGEVYFYKDIYGIDSKELEELAPYMGI